MRETLQEVLSQPEVWRRAAALREEVRELVPAGERVAFVGCGTSWFVAQAVAVLREQAGLGESDAFAASEVPAGRRYDRVVVISRSAATTEAARYLRTLQGVPTVAVTGVPTGAVADAADRTLVLDFADETSVVQTRFATGVVALFRAAFGEDLAAAVAQAEALVAGVTEPEHPLAGSDRFVFLGHGWTVGLAHEAALKLREASLATTESHPAMEYRHGPVALAGPGTAVVLLGPDAAGIAPELRALGADVVEDAGDPLVQLVQVHLLALAIARRKGLDPDTPRNLTRAVVLEPAP